MLRRLIVLLIVACAQAGATWADEPTIVRPAVPVGEPSDSLTFSSTFWPGAKISVDAIGRDGLRRIRVSGCSANGAELVSPAFASPPKVLIAYELGYPTAERPETCTINVLVHFVRDAPNIGLRQLESRGVELIVMRGRIDVSLE